MWQGNTEIYDQPNSTVQSEQGPTAWRLTVNERSDT